MPNLSANQSKSGSDSDYDDDMATADDSLEIARRTYNQQLSDAFKDGFREGFDKGQLQIAQRAFNNAHSQAAKAQFAYGQFHGIMKLLEHKYQHDEELQVVLSSLKKSGANIADVLASLDSLQSTNLVKHNTSLQSLLTHVRSTLSPS